MSNIDVPQVLSYGVTGLGFLLAWLAYCLLSREQKKSTSDSKILAAVHIFMGFSVVLCLIGLASELFKNPRQATTTLSTPPPSVAENYVVLSGNDEGGRNVMAEDLSLDRRGNVLSGEGRDLDSEKKSWHYSGYLNGAYLVLAYRSVDPDGIGFGTYFLEQAGSNGDLYKGHLEGNSCAKAGDGPARRIVRCNAILVRGRPGGNEEQNIRKEYKEYLGDSSCKILKPADLVAAEKCTSSKTKSN